MLFSNLWKQNSGGREGKGGRKIEKFEIGLRLFQKRETSFLLLTRASRDKEKIQNSCVRDKFYSLPVFLSLSLSLGIHSVLTIRIAFT